MGLVMSLASLCSSARSRQDSLLLSCLPLVMSGSAISNLIALSLLGCLRAILVSAVMRRFSTVRLVLISIIVTAAAAIAGSTPTPHIIKTSSMLAWWVSVRPRLLALTPRYPALVATREVTIFAMRTASHGRVG